MNLNWIKNRKTLAALLAVVAVSCSQERSPVTGWAYNDATNGGFEKPPYEEQETGPGLVLIEGGTFSMGRTDILWRGKLGVEIIIVWTEEWAIAVHG